MAELGIVSLYADYSQRSPEIKKWLDKFNSKSIPLLVIFPANDPENVIILRDLYTKSTLLENLRKAGPSLDRQSASRSAGTQK